MRRDLEQNDEAKAYMQALRGAGIQDYASAQGEMRLAQIEDGEAEGAGGEADRLPMSYDPDALKAYFSRRPQVGRGDRRVERWIRFYHRRNGDEAEIVRPVYAPLPSIRCLDRVFLE